MVAYLILINHHPQHALLVFIHVLVLPVHRVRPFLGEFQEEDLPTKQPTKQILGPLWGYSFFFSYFLWLVLCFPAVDWSVSGSVSDWWSYASKHVSSATPMLPACLETLNNWGKRRLLLKLCVSGWKSLLWGRRFLDSWSHYDLSPASRVLPVYSRYLIFIMFYNFLFIQSKRSITRIIGLLSSGSCSLLFTQGAAFTVYQECVLTPRAVCELEADTTMAVNHFWQFDCSRCTNTVCKTWNCSGDNNKGVILEPLWTHST